MQTAVYNSLSLPSSYPKSSITVTLTSNSLRMAGTAEQLAAASSTAAVRPTGKMAIFTAEIADQPIGSLPSDVGFLLIASPALLAPGKPFGAGMAAQACDASGNVANPIGKRVSAAYALWQCSYIVLI